MTKVSDFQTDSQRTIALISWIVPTRSEVSNDTTKLVKSIKSIARLILTSSAFRLLLSDLFASARELLAQTAAEVGAVALQVQITAEGVERAANIEGGSLNTLTGHVQEAVGGVLDILDEARNQPSTQEPTKDAFIARMQDVCSFYNLA